MTRVVLFEDAAFTHFLPLLYWRSIFEIRVGRKILLDGIAQRLGLPVSGIWARDWIAPIAGQRCGAPVNQAVRAGDVLVNGRWIPDDRVAFPKGATVGVLGDSIAFVVCDERSANQLTPAIMLDSEAQRKVLSSVPKMEVTGRILTYPWDITSQLSSFLTADWTPSDASIEPKLDHRVTIIGTDRVHIGERSELHPTCVIDASNGPIYLSHDVKVGPYAVVEGPAYVGPGSRINAHAWLHGPNAVGPLCKLGGEIDGCVVDGFSNKQHLGFLGHSYVGCWVNIGAGTSNSDLKNTYGSVRVPINGVEVDSKQMFFGAIIGDHAKIGINSSIPTGAVVGFASVAAASGLLPKFVRSFGWVTPDRVTSGDPPRLLDVAVKMMARRNVDMTDAEVELFLELSDRAKSFEK